MRVKSWTTSHIREALPTYRKALEEYKQREGFENAISHYENAIYEFEQELKRRGLTK